MKKVGISLIVMVVLLSVMGCGKEFSSREEAIYATRELLGCKEIVYCLSVRGSGSNIILPAATFRIGESKSSYRVAHIVVYKDDKDSIIVAVWDDQRPPQQLEVAVEVAQPAVAGR